MEFTRPGIWDIEISLRNTAPKRVLHKLMSVFFLWSKLELNRASFWQNYLIIMTFGIISRICIDQIRNKINWYRRNTRHSGQKTVF